MNKGGRREGGKDGRQGGQEGQGGQRGQGGQGGQEDRGDPIFLTPPSQVLPSPSPSPIPGTRTNSKILKKFGPRTRPC
jgi:hypothetical protein